MHAKLSFQLLLVILGLTLASSANILDLLIWDSDNESNSQKREDEPNQDGERTCDCYGPACTCCVDFKITFIDLGGPGCVSMKYLSQAEGLMVNVSYGKSVLKSAQIKSTDPKPTCISLLTNLAEVCARFSSLDVYNDGLKGCLQLEPKLLGDLQTQFNIGCFVMGPNEIKLDETAAAVTENTDYNNTTTSQAEQLSEEYILAAVSESAQQGLAFIGNIFGFSFEEKSGNGTEVTEEIEETEAKNEDIPV